MKKRKVIPLALLCILFIAVLVAPVVAEDLTGLKIEGTSKITTTDGATLRVFTIIDTPIDQGDTITIDVTSLNDFVANYSFTTDNVIINDHAANATWTGVVADNILTLTSTGGITNPNETVNVTFTGAENPWMPDTGEQEIFLAANRIDKPEGASFSIVIDAVVPVPHGLSISGGDDIVSPDGSTTRVITITEENITPGGAITIDVSKLNYRVANGTLTDANVVIGDTAVAATWTRVVSGNILTLTSTGGATAIDETVNLTFTGAVNPWESDTGGRKIARFTATRTDGFGFGYFDFVIFTKLPGGLRGADGAKITETDGVSSPVITITNEEIPVNGNITINITDLHQYSASGNFTTENVLISSNAVAATWNGIVNRDILTLRSTGGVTAVGKTITVTFTGAINPWIADTGGEKTARLTAIRTDTNQTGSFNFMISTGGPVADFTASPTADIAPLTVTFTDTSLGHPTSWAWDINNDGVVDYTTRNPSHTYTDVGTYTVNLTATYAAYGPKTKTRSDYIHVLNGAVREANTAIDGLTITNCRGTQTIMVNTSILPATLSPNNSVLEIQPPADSGFNTITIYAMNKKGFSRNGTLITGNPTGVHLVSEEIAPYPGFSSEIGTNASFNYSIDLASYPCNAILSTKIWEGVIPKYDNKFRWIASNNSAFPVGTAYTAKITKTNFPSGTRVKVHMSVDSYWTTFIGDPTSTLFIWRIADDEKSGQFLPTTHLYTDPVNNLAYFEADSPLGLSTFGISATTGNNNPFQLIAFVAANVISQSGNPGSSGVVQTTIVP